jgi:hypothetical protein
VLYLAVVKHGLRALAYTFDNGYRSPQAVENVDNAVRILNTDHVVLKPNKVTLKTLFHTFLTKTGEFCTPCNMYIGTGAKRIAQQHRIPLILTGNSRRLSAAIEGVSISGYFDRSYYLNVIKDTIPYCDVMGRIEEANWVKGLKRLTGTAATKLDVLDYISTPVAEMEHTLANELGWKRAGQGLEHGDCLLDHLKDYLVCRKWGCSEVTGFISSLVRNGEVSREEALILASREERSEPPSITHDFREALGLSNEQFDEALSHDFHGIPNRRKSKLFRIGKAILDGFETTLFRK